MGFSWQEYWSGLPFPSPGIFLTQGSNPGSPSLPSEPPGKPFFFFLLETEVKSRAFSSCGSGCPTYIPQPSPPPAPLKELSLPQPAPVPLSEHHPLLVAACLVRAEELGIHFSQGVAPTSHGDVGVENLQLLA